MEAKKKTTNQMISVDAGKLSQGLKTTFEGVAMVFGSLGIPVEMPLEEKAEQPEPEPAVEADVKEAPAAELETETTDAPVEPEVTEPEAPAAPEEPKKDTSATPSVSIDDITRIIVQKIKQNRKNNEAIGAILKTYGAARVGDLPADKYEAFLTDLSAI